MNERIIKLAEQRGLVGPNFLVSSKELEKTVHSQNPVGARNIRELLDGFIFLYEKLLQNNLPAM